MCGLRPIILFMAELSDLDRRLISALRKDGRAPVARLAEELGVSRGTVTHRIERLRAKGVILGFTVQTREDAQLDQVRAVTLIEVAGRTTQHVIAELRALPQIRRLHSTNGGWDLVAEIGCENLQDFDAVLGRIRGTPGIVNSESSILLSSLVR